MALAGAISVFSFAPFYLYPVMWVSMAVLLIGVCRADSARQAGWRTFAYSMGFHLANVYWVYISLHTYGGMLPPLAIFLVLLLGLYLAFFPTLAIYLGCRLTRSTTLRLFLLPALWTLAEWIRGWLFTGFPWSYVGYSQIPNAPLAGFTAILGIHGISFLLVSSVALVVWGCYFSRRHLIPSLAVLCCLWGAGFGLRFVDWTEPYGKPLSVSVLQGNIPQSLKWQPRILPQTLDTYFRLIRQSTGELIILPETAIPIFLQNLPNSYLELFLLANNGRTLIVGAPMLDEGNNRYYNSAVLLSDPTMPFYSKNHLVPFGEYVPARHLLGWIFDSLNIPLTDFSRGGKKQPPFIVNGQRIAMNICYEDTFGQEIIRALPQATILANISNLAWFDGSVALAQHGQIAQARALETGRPMLRATNTGLTAIIDHRGQFIQQAPIGQEAVITATVQGRSGMTPYARTGNRSILAIVWTTLLFGLIFARRKPKHRTNQTIV